MKIAVQRRAPTRQRRPSPQTEAPAPGARADVVAALRTTFKAGTRFNKRRAAADLGWDPDTLVARLEELSIDEETIQADPHPWGM